MEDKKCGLACDKTMKRKVKAYGFGTSSHSPSAGSVKAQ